jgi:peptidoglycan-associated lipoprotein
VNNRKKQWILAVLLSSVLALVVGCEKKKTPPPPPPPPKPVTATLSANPTSIQRGQSANLTWSTDNATDVTLEGNKVDPSGSQTVSPTDTTTYHLSAKGASGTQDATATITVAAPPPPPTPTPAPPPPPATLAVTDIYFDYDKADLRPESQAALSQIAQLMSQNPNSKVKIEGNCDDRGSAMYNLALGERRANAAMQALTQAGVPASSLQSVSYGKEKPVCNDANEACWQKNRHDHFVLQP